jgi:hypothetical protein
MSDPTFPIKKVALITVNPMPGFPLPGIARITAINDIKAFRSAIATLRILMTRVRFPVVGVGAGAGGVWSGDNMGVINGSERLLE